MIDSPSNPSVKALRLLSTSKGRREQGRYLVEGVRLVEDGMDAGERPLICLYNYDLAGRTERGRALISRLTSSDALLLEASERALVAASDTPHPQGIVAAFPLRQWSQPTPPSHPALILVCDSVQDPGNMGTLLRSAEAAGVDAVLLSPGCVDIYSPKVVRAAMGSHFRLPTYSQSWEEIACFLTDFGVPASGMYASDTHSEMTYDMVDWTHPSALMISSEAHGISDEARAIAEEAGFVSIPMAGKTESLNAAVAGAVVLFEAARQRRAAPAPKVR